MFHDSMEHTEPIRKITNEKMYDRLHPNRLVAHPEIGTASPIARTYPVVIHWTVDMAAFISVAIVWMATLTIVESNSGASAPTTRIMAALSTIGSSFSFAGFTASVLMRMLLS